MNSVIVFPDVPCVASILSRSFLSQPVVVNLCNRTLKAPKQGKIDVSFSPMLHIYAFATEDVDTTYAAGQHLSEAPPREYLAYKQDLRLLDPTEASMTLDVAWDPISEVYRVTFADSFTAMSMMSLAGPGCPCPPPAKKPEVSGISIAVARSTAIK